jgi:PTS system galactitol-specific IIA component
VINQIDSLFNEDLIFIENGKDSSEIFTKVGKKLIERGLVENVFIEEVIKREKNYPTGMNLGVVYSKEENIPNIAIPHTETEYCNTKNVVVVKLENDIIFNDMIHPNENFNVRFLFILLNNEKDSQTNILSNLMGFVTNKDNMCKLCSATAPKDIYNSIVK